MSSASSSCRDFADAPADRVTKTAVAIPTGAMKARTKLQSPRDRDASLRRRSLYVEESAVKQALHRNHKEMKPLYDDVYPQRCLNAKPYDVDQSSGTNGVPALRALLDIEGQRPFHACALYCC